MFPLAVAALLGALTEAASVHITARDTFSEVSASYSCSTGQYINVQITAEPSIINVSPPANQSELTALETRLASQSPNMTELVGGTYSLQTSYDIWSYLCIPPGFDAGTGLLEFAIHGINFDHSYWTFGGPGSQYNYAESALRAGHAMFFYDRLSVGKSAKPDGIKEVQLPTEIEVAAALVRQLRGTGVNGYKFTKVVGVGHSFGSDQTLGLAAKYPDLLDASVLTGFSTYTKGMNAVDAAFDLMIAAEQNPTRFAGLSNSYLATGGITGDQLNFFNYPDFDPSVLQLAENTKGTLTIGELLTQTTMMASSYTKPVFIVTGAKDFIFCGGNCYQEYDGYKNIPEAAKKVFPATSDFSTYIPAGTGHAANQHYSSPETYRVIEAWIEKRFPRGS